MESPRKIYLEFGSLYRVLRLEILCIFHLENLENVVLKNPDYLAYESRERKV